jgi:hypothetical protein
MKREIPQYFKRRFVFNDVIHSFHSKIDYNSFIQEYNLFYEDLKEQIENFDNFKLNEEKREYLKNPKFSLHIVKNRTTSDSIIAQVKWMYPIGNKVKKSKFHSIYIGTTNQLGTDIKSEVVFKKAQQIINQYFIEKSSDLPVNESMLQEYKEITEFFDFIRSKKDEILARINPQFYISKNNTKSNYKAIVANIKWGFPYPGRNGKPRYISFYLGSENEIKDDVNTDKYKEHIKPKVIEYLTKISY